MFAVLSIFFLTTLCTPQVITATAPEHKNSSGLSKCWEKTVSLDPEAGVAVVGSDTIFGSVPARVVQLKSATGDVLWTSDIGGRFVSPIIVDDAVVYVITSRNGGVGGDGVQMDVRTLSNETGLTIWRAALPFSSVMSAVPATSGIAITTQKGDVYFYSKTSGQLLWHLSVGELTSASAVGGDKLILATKEKNILLIDLTDGRVADSVDLGFLPSLVAELGSLTIVADGKGELVSLNIRGHDRLWDFRAGGKIVEIIPTGDDRILVASDDNFVYLMSAAYGNIIWKRRMPGRILYGRLLKDGQVVFTVIGEKNAFVLDLDKGKVVDKITLGTDEEFIPIKIGASENGFIVPTSKGLNYYSSRCSIEKAAFLHRAGASGAK